MNINVTLCRPDLPKSALCMLRIGMLSASLASRSESYRMQ